MPIQARIELKKWGKRHQSLAGKKSSLRRKTEKKKKKITTRETAIRAIAELSSTKKGGN